MELGLREMCAAFTKKKDNDSNRANLFSQHSFHLFMRFLLVFPFQCSMWNLAEEEQTPSLGKPKGVLIQLVQCY